MILVAGPLDVNPTAVLLLQPLFLLLSLVGGTVAVLPCTRTSEVSHSSPSATPLPRLPHLRVVPVWASSSSTGLGALGTVWSTWSTTESHRKMTVRERLIVGTHHAHGCMHATERGEVNVVKERLPSEVYCKWRVSAGSTAAASKCLLITRKIMIPPTNSRDPLDDHRILRKKRLPPDCWDPPNGPPYFAKKTFPLLSARTHRK